MPPVSPPPIPARHSGALRWNAWNLLLLVPLLMLITPWFNRDEPRLLGLPFFYWYQFAFVPVGVLCVWLVYIKTKGEPVRPESSDQPSVDDLDSGTAGGNR